MSDDCLGKQEDLMARVDTSVPVSARIWNYWMGGNDYYPIDKQAGDAYAQMSPGVFDLARSCRSYLVRAVRYTAGDAGVRQFLDIGSGLPSNDPTHQSRASCGASNLYRDSRSALSTIAFSTKDSDVITKHSCPVSSRPRRGRLVRRLTDGCSRCERRRRGRSRSAGPCPSRISGGAALRQTHWSLITAALRGRPTRPDPRTPRPHQEQAVAAAMRHYGKRAARGRLIMPCGTGKSLTAFWIAEALEARNILVAVPVSHSSARAWRIGLASIIARGQRPDWLCVCSDESVAAVETDSFVAETYDLGIPTTTRPR